MPQIIRCPAFEPILTKPTKANFQDIEKVFELESSKPLKMGYKLNASVISPKSIEKTSTKLALAVFNESTINALKLYGFNDTATIVGIFTKLWNVLNVKTTNIGKRKGDITRDPVKHIQDWKLNFLLEFVRFLDMRETSEVSRL